MRMRELQTVWDIISVDCPDSTWRESMTLVDRYCLTRKMLLLKELVRCLEEETENFIILCLVSWQVPWQPFSRRKREDPCVRSLETMVGVKVREWRNIWQITLWYRESITLFHMHSARNHIRIRIVHHISMLMDTIRSTGHLAV